MKPSLDLACKANNFHYNKNLKHFANANRKTLTKSAACMWKYLLSKRQMMGYQFRRERPILNFIADFVCFDLMLIIEVDGITHMDPEAQAKDAQRDDVLRSVGFEVLRFSSSEVLTEMIQVSQAIGEWIEGQSDRIPPPGSRKRGVKRRFPPRARD